LETLLSLPAAASHSPTQPAADGPSRNTPPTGEAPAAGAGGQIVRAVGLISVMVMLSRGLGFVRDALIAAQFGQNAIVSAYTYAFTLPDTLWMLVAGGAFYAAYVPVITEYFTRGEEENAWKTFSVITTFLFVVLSVVIPLCWIFARPILQHVLAPNFTDDVVVPPFGRVHPLSMAVTMTRIVLPAQYCFFLGTLMMGMLQARHRFLMPALGPVIYNVGIILGGLLLGRSLGIAAFSWGALAGALVGNLLLQVWAVRAIGARFRPSLDLSFPGVKRAGKLVLPVICGVSLPQVTAIVNGIFVADIASARSILENSNRLMQLPLGIFGQAIGIAVLPTLSQQAAQSDLPRFRATLAHGVRLSLFLTVPASALMMVLAGPLIAMVFQRGHFTAADTANAVPALVFYSLGVAAWSAQSVVARAFYARNDTWTPVLAGTGVTLLLFVPLNIVLRPLFDVAGTPLLTRGPALAASIASTANVLLLLWFAHRRFGGIHGREILGSLVRTMAGSLLLAAGAWGAAALVARVLPPGQARSAAQLLGGGLAGTGLFLLTTRLLGSEELREVGTLVRRRRRS
jgi:putative peptidoglycan lipid II flippase